MEPIDYESRIKELEKMVRILKKKLERSESDRTQLEEAGELREAVLKNSIRELEKSQSSLKKRSDELENTLTNLQALQVKLIESEKMSALGVMVAGIAHEINNPVSFIYGNLDYANNYFQDLLDLLQLYKQYYPEPVLVIQTKIKELDFEFIIQDIDKIFHSMKIGAERIRDIVLSLRNFSRIDEAKLKKVDIHEGIESTLVILNNRLIPTQDLPNGIRIIRNYEAFSLIECFSGQLNQAFMNIIINAIDALEEENIKHYATLQRDSSFIPTLSICTRFVNSDWIAISIIDNGKGINKAVLSKLFDPFFTTKPIGKGTGLGLTISYKIIVELHGGKIECYSTPELGTEFLIQIPIRQS
ncbi:PAS/PAC sensor signal transduction histidine kinase (plasmid) [Calothrix sp. NIES-4101]|nr:PAS/PAC sensor signal transduction histidine kinase [Calothrix sp. NIES-4101]